MIIDGSSTDPLQVAICSNIRIHQTDRPQKLFGAYMNWWDTEKCKGQIVKQHNFDPWKHCQILNSSESEKYRLKEDPNYPSGCTAQTRIIKTKRRLWFEVDLRNIGPKLRPKVKEALKDARLFTLIE